MLTIYETILLLKNVPKEQLSTSIRRTSDYILNKDGFFRNIHYLGLRKLPYRHTKEKNPYWEANYIFLEFNVPKARLPIICDEWKRDRDVIKFTVFPREMLRPIPFEECTFEDEMAPVPYRSEVQKFVQLTRQYAKRFKRKNLHLPSWYYPFQR